MGNASKILQTVAANIDRDVINPLLTSLYDMVMLTDTSGTFKGDESIRVRGVDVAVQRETSRMRQMELLQITANPIDMQIMGPEGRAKLLRGVSEEVGITGIVPTEEELMAKLKQEQQAQAAMMAAQQEQELRQEGEKKMGVSPAAKPANTDLGVQEAGAMRGMAGGVQSFQRGGLVELPNGMRLEIPEPPPPEHDVPTLLHRLIETERAPIEFQRDPNTGRIVRMERLLPPSDETDF
jgi:hypothetical protein